MAKSRECKFIVSSAEEAVERVRSTLGPEGRVISVKQVKGSGLQRFMAAPKLEIIARLDPPVEEPALEPPPKEVSVSVAPASGQGNGSSPAEALFEKTLTASQRAGDAKPPSAKDTDAAPMKSGADVQSALTCGRFLERAGLGVELLARLEAADSWREIGEMPVEEGLPRAVSWLRNYRKHRATPQSGSPLAFIGGPGAGKTTAICKLLARDVLIHGLRPQVLRLEVDKPHLDDGAILYCEALGIHCAQRWSDLDRSEERPIYIDIPGFGLREQKEQDRIRKALDDSEVEQRVMVINGAYERAVVQRYCDCGDQMGARFQVFTHVDELDEVGKLWERVLDRERTVLFFSDGQNLANGRVEDSFGYLMERTFPR